ncbi:PH domain-containing protein [Tomitella gaofuii]|uniref:PH domain-containing protein n=1 Tax=Tomitella gaofuii TaxID=2760083 RepID=UPI0015FBF740|nr:PH domain-containing protein [Tomitella gaofuii]
MSPSHDVPPDDTPAEEQPPAAPAPAVFRIPGSGYFVVACLAALILIPVLNWPAYTGWLLLIPVFLAWWVARMRTTVSPAGAEVRTTTGHRSVPWDQVRGVVFPHPRVFGISWARAYLRDGTVVRLSAVTWNDIPRVSQASGGRLPDPTVLRSQAPADDAGDDAPARADRVEEDPE